MYFSLWMSQQFVIKSRVASRPREVTLPLCSGETPLAVLCPALECPAREGRSCHWNKSREGYEDAQRARALLLWRQDEKAGVSLEKRRFQGESGVPFHPLGTSEPLKRLQG